MTMTKPTFPPTDKVQEALLLLLFKRGGDSNALWAEDTYEPLADFFILSEHDRSVTRHALSNDGHNEPYWHTMVQFARQRLVDNKDLHKPDVHWHVGIWRLTEQGKRSAASLAAGRSRAAFADHRPIAPVHAAQLGKFPAKITLKDLGLT